MFEHFSISPLQFFEATIAPTFADLVPGNMPYDGTLHEFTLMDDVVNKRPIIDIRRVKNILQRRDASCDINYKRVAGVGTRQIEVMELAGGAKHCKHEFYQGCLKDWRNDDPLFGNKVLPFFQDAAKTDIASNSYFGKVSRVVNPAWQWSLNLYDGVFEWIFKYINAGVIPATQTITIPAGMDFRQKTADAYQLIKQLYDKQNTLMRSFPAKEKAFYVSQAVADGYRTYLQQLGNGSCCAIEAYTNGIDILAYNGIPIYVEPIWEPILEELNGANTHAAILTLRGNFVFATDKRYGEGPELNEALMVWYEERELSWYYQMFLKAGTQIALPEHVVIALSKFNL